MAYYNPLSETDCQATVDKLTKDGWEVTLNRITATLKRKTSKYNKYMKWHYQTFREDGSLLSGQYFKSKPQAMEHISRLVRPFPIGDRFSVTHVFLVGG